MHTKRKIIISGFVIVALFLLGFGASKNIVYGNTVMKEETMLITKEYLIETCELTEEEYADVDLDAFIEKYQFTEDAITKLNMHTVLKYYKEKLNKEEVYDENAVFYEYLTEIEEVEGKMTEEDIENINVIALHIASGSDNDSIIVDYEKNMIYYGNQMGLVADGLVPTKAVELDEEKKSLINTMWDECEILLWERNYLGTYEETVGRYDWWLCFELKDGTTKIYRGSGADENGRPSKFGKFVSTLNSWNIHYIAKDYLIDMYELSEKDYEGIDLDAFIEEYEITDDVARQNDIRIWLEEYKTNQNIQPSEGTSENE